MQISAPRALPLAVLTVVLSVMAGCGGDGESSPPPAKAADSTASTPAATRAASSSSKVTRAEATLRSSGGSAATGAATLAQAADKVEYRVDASGVSAGAHAMYLLQNATCAAGGNRTGPLVLLDASADGNGTAEGTMLTELTSLVGRSLAIYSGDKGDSEIVACGQITAAP